MRLFFRCALGLSGALFLPAAYCTDQPAAPAAQSPATTPADPAPNADAWTAALAAMDREDFVAAGRLLAPLAADDMADAQHLLGFLYDLGLGVAYDPIEGTHLQEKAAAQKHYWARLYLGWRCGIGLGLEKADARRATALQAVLYEQTPPARIISTDWLRVTGIRFLPNYPRAARWLTPRAEAGDAQAAAALAEYALVGLGGKQSMEQHLRWLRVAADGGNAGAAERLSLYYAAGLFVTADREQAAAYLRRAAESGSASAQCSMAEDLVAKKDPIAAVEWYRKSAAQKHLPAINALADLLREGAPGIPQDYAEALRLSRQGMELGDAEATADVAGMTLDGHGTAINVPEALRLYREAAGKGYTHAKMMVGWLLVSDRLGQPDYVEGRHWLELAANDGNNGAQYQIGQLYLYGRGTTADPVEAFRWFERAARDGHNDAQNEVGWMLLNGTGIEADPEEAVTWFKLAAKQDNTTAITNLGLCYVNGTGVPHDPRLAAEQFRRAHELGEIHGAANFAAAALLDSSDSQPALLDEATRMFQAKTAASRNSYDTTMFAQVLISQKNPRRDVAGGLALLEEAARDRPQLLAQIALLYINNEGIPRDAVKARAYAERAAAPGENREPYVLGLFLLAGVGGPIEAERGATLVLEAAAKNPIVPAYLYWSGRGVTKDDAKAYDYLTKGATPGTEWANVTKGTSPDQALAKAFGAGNAPFPYNDGVARRPPGQDGPLKVILVVQPVYPFLERMLGLDGEVQVQGTVTATGELADVSVQSSPWPGLGDAAVAAVKQWRFLPRVSGGKPVSTKMIIPVVMRLDEKRPNGLSGLSTSILPNDK